MKTNHSITTRISFMRRRNQFLFLLLLVCSLSAVTAYAQSATATLSGTVTDERNAVVAAAKVSAVNDATSLTRKATTNSDGFFTLPLLPPGNYTLRIEGQGFAILEKRDVMLNVGDQRSVYITLKVGAVQEMVNVSGEATTSTANDAGRGNAIGATEVKTLPFVARNPINLLTLQPGVIFTGQSDTDRLFQGATIDLNQREGVVNGVRGNQTNVTVDGADANDFETQAAFTSVLPLTLDSLQELRVTTANANATSGVAAGAQVQLVTKSGANTFHGNLREYHRNTVTAANSFFNNTAGVDRPALLRNVFGGSLGGRLRRDRAFFFVDYEGRRDASESSEARNGPNEDLKRGILRYRTTTGSVATLTPADIRALDPAGIGVNPTALQYLSLYPTGNSPGDAPDGGLALTGMRFNAPVRTAQNIYTARFDVSLTANGRHTAFTRGILGDIKADAQAPHFPGLPPVSLLLNNSKGVLVSYTGQFGSAMVNTARYSFTRQGLERSGARGPFLTTAAFSAYFAGGDFFTGSGRASGRAVPVQMVEDDLTISRGAHTWQFGGALRFTRNRRFDEVNSYPTYYIFPFSLLDSPDDPYNRLLNDGNPNNNPDDFFLFGTLLQSLTGTISLIDVTFQVDPQQKRFLPAGSSQVRTFAENGVEWYAQDTWRLRSNLTVTAGLRYSYYTPVYDTRGAMVRPTVDMRDWFNRRQRDMYAGIPSDAAPLIGFDLAGKANNRPAWHDPDRNNFAPRMALAYSPSFKSGVGKMLFGNGGRSTIRSGFGVYFHRVGGALAAALDKFGSPGLSTSVFSPFGGVYTFKNAPRYSGQSTENGTPGLPPITAYLTPPQNATFPFFFERSAGANGFLIDNRLSTPYTMSASLSFQRELPHRFTVDVGYVGTFGRQQLSYVDLAQQYGYLPDSASGQTLWGAFNRIVDLIGSDPLRPRINPSDNAAVSRIAPIAFFENMLSNLPAFSGKTGLSATQAFYVLAANARGSWSRVLQGIDTGIAPGNSPWNARIDPQRDGYVLFHPQYNSLAAYTNFGSSNYHSLQFTLRRNFGAALIGVNYVLSKSIDNGSTPENNDLIFGAAGADMIQNAYRINDSRAVSNFDLRHNFNAHGVFDLPFGQGRKFAAQTGAAINQLIGGWGVTGVWRWRSGFPLNILNGVAYPTNFLNQGPATLTGPLRSEITRRDTVGQANLFTNPTSALSNFGYTRPGESGTRNAVRGPGYFNVDLGVQKRFRLPWKETHALEFRAIAFNAFNNVNFAAGYFQSSLRINSTSTFGRLNATAGGSRQFEFALRYEF